jgi:hypothetical protein
LPHTRRGEGALEEERDRHLQDLGNVLEATGAADAITMLNVTNEIDTSSEHSPARDMADSALRRNMGE